MSPFGAGVPAPGNPCGMFTVVFRFRCWPAPKSLNRPCRMPAEGTTPVMASGASVWSCHSQPTKKNALSRSLLKLVPGTRIGPERVKPGYWNFVFGRSWFA